MALAVSRFVGRINIRSRPGRTAGFGTGFMVSPRRLLTNNHVLRTERDALYSEVEFDYQYDRYGRLLPVVVYRLEPETFFITSKTGLYPGGGAGIIAQRHRAEGIRLEPTDRGAG